MAARGGVAMTDLFLLSEAQMRRIEPFFTLSHGVPRVDDRRVIRAFPGEVGTGSPSGNALALLWQINEMLRIWI
jgi:hypothetical protein